MLNERRASPRVNVLADYSGMILVEVPSLRTSGLLIDLSEQGMAVQFAVPVSEVSTIDVDFLLGDKRVTGTCDAIWSTPATWGLRFAALPEEHRADIAGWLETIRATYELPSTVASGSTAIADTPEPADTPSHYNNIYESMESLFPESGPANPGPLPIRGAVFSTVGDTPTPNGSTDGNVPQIDRANLTSADPNVASMAELIRGDVAGSGRPPKLIQPDWAVRMVTRQQLDRIERLKSWREEHRNRRELPWEPARHDANPPAGGDPARFTIGSVENKRGDVATDVAVLTPDSQSFSDDEILNLLRIQNGRAAKLPRFPTVRWITTIILAASLAMNLWWLLKKHNFRWPSPEPAASLVHSDWTSADAQSRRPVVTGVVEIAEGKPVLHYHVHSKAFRPRITAGTPFRRELPTYDNAALASGVQGDIYAVLTITDRGIVQDVRVNQGNRILAKQVIKAAGHWRYTPYFVGSEPVTVDLPVTVKFRLRRRVGVQRPTAAAPQ